MYMNIYQDSVQWKRQCSYMRQTCGWWLLYLEKLGRLISWDCQTCDAIVLIPDNGAEVTDTGSTGGDTSDSDVWQEPGVVGVGG